MPLIGRDQLVGEAVALMVGSGLPTLPVVDDERHLAGIFGERDFSTALFPGDVRSLW